MIGIYAFLFTAGAQLGPVITGYLVQGTTWQWFSYLCAILNGLNLLLTLFLLPETSFRRQIFQGETAAKIDENAKVESMTHVQQVDYVEVIPPSAVNSAYAGNYLKDLVQLRNRGLEERGMREWGYRFVEPFQFLLVPQAIFAAFSFGLILAG